MQKIIDAPWMECECGGITFTPLVVMKKISKLLSGDPQDKIIEIPMMKCDTCAGIPLFMHKNFPDFPEKLKATPIVE